MKIPIAEIKRILEYLYESEKKDFEISDNKTNHIFNDIQKQAFVASSSPPTEPSRCSQCYR